MSGIDLVLIGRDGDAQAEFRRPAGGSAPRAGKSRGRMTPAAQLAIGAVRAYQWTSAR